MAGYIRKRRYPFGGKTGGSFRKRWSRRRVFRRRNNFRRYKKYTRKRPSLTSVKYNNIPVRTLFRSKSIDLTSKAAGTERVIQGILCGGLDLLRNQLGYGNELSGYVNMYEQFRVKSVSQSFWAKHADLITNPAKDEMVTLYTCYDTDAGGRTFIDKESFIQTPHCRIRFMRPFKVSTIKLYPKLASNTFASYTLDGPPLYDTKGAATGWLDTAILNSADKGTPWANGIQWYIDGITEGGIVANETVIRSRSVWVIEFRGVRRGNGYG